MIRHYIEYLIGGRFLLDTDVRELTARFLPSRESRPANAIGYRFFSRETAFSDSGEVLQGARKDDSPTTYFGTELTLTQVKERARPEDSTLIWNMEVNGYDRVVMTVHDQAYQLGPDDLVVGA